MEQNETIVAEPVEVMDELVLFTEKKVNESHVYEKNHGDPTELFIQRRAQGVSYNKIAKEIGISRRTLFNWAQNYCLEIRNAKAMAQDSIVQQFCLSKQMRLQVLGKQLKKIEAEILSRDDFDEISTPKLLDMLLSIYSLIQKEELSLTFQHINHLGNISRDQTWIEKE